MNKVLLSLLATTMFLGFNTEAYANHCNYLRVELYTRPDLICQLKRAIVAHGTIVSGAVPGQITPTPTFFKVEQSATNGPSVIAIYDCDGREVLFESTQHFCDIKAHTPKAKTPNKEFATAKRIVTGSGYPPTKSGLIEWKIS